MKAKKGNPFEYDTAYSLQQADYKVERIDDNTKGVDLIAENSSGYKLAIECKFHKGFSWNQLTKIFLKTELYVLTNLDKNYKPLLIFKSNRQPVLVFFRNNIGHLTITSFTNFFYTAWSKRPKGYKIWQN